jgi:hypothetical protein
VRLWLLQFILVPLLLLQGCRTSQSDTFDTRFPDEPRSSESSKTANSSVVSVADQIRSRALGGEAQAQFELGEMFESGQIVAKDYTEAWRWWLRAANQGLAVAQRKVGIAYATGIGVAPNRVAAFEWLGKARTQGDSVAAAYIDALTRDIMKGAEPRNVQVVHTQDEAKELTADPNTVVYVAPAQLPKAPAHAPMQGPDAAAKLAILQDILSEYHKNHTYTLSNMFVCVDMANDVWDQVQTRQIPAKVCVGCVTRDISTTLDADHAWVMAEVAPRAWVALETTAGQIVPESANPRYYRNLHTFDNPKELKEYQALAREFNAAQEKRNKAVEDYNRVADQFNAAVSNPLSTGLFGLQSLNDQVRERKTVLDAREADLDEVTARMKAVLSEK